MARGTTTSTGLVKSYFANIFGPPQYRPLHDQLAERTFQAAFTSGVWVGQLRTRLGVRGFERQGPEAAARAMIELLESGDVPHPARDVASASEVISLNAVAMRREA